MTDEKKQVNDSLSKLEDLVGLLGLLVYDLEQVFRRKNKCHTTKEC